VANPGVEKRMKDLEAALGASLDAEDDLLVNWKDDDQLSATFDLIEGTLNKSVTPDRDTLDVFDESAGSQGS
jgi:hypothetical protein